VSDERSTAVPEGFRRLTLAAKLQWLYEDRGRQEQRDLSDPMVAREINEMVRADHERHEHLRRQKAAQACEPFDEEKAAAELRASTISPAYLWKIRNGLGENPTTRHLVSLARYFKIRTSLLLPDDELNESRGEQLDTLQVLAENPGILRLALRARELSPKDLSVIRNLVEYMRSSQDEAASPPSA
jgi:transcriptional regulator with XRE-family HTH domain